MYLVDSKLPFQSQDYFFKSSLPLENPYSQKVDEFLADQGFTWSMRQIVTDYVGIENKVKTQEMLDLVLRVLKQMNQKETALNYPEIKEGEPLKASLEKKLLTVMHQLRDYITKAIAALEERLQSEPLKRSLHCTYWNIQQEFYNFYDRIKNVKIIEKRDSIADNKVSNMCHTYVFQNDQWFKDFHRPNCFLHLKYNLSINILRSEGYAIQDSLKEGHKIVYVNPKGIVGHYGVVKKIEADGTVMAVSKWGPFHVYEHSIELVPDSYGTRFFTLDQNPDIFYI